MLNFQTLLSSLSLIVFAGAAQAQNPNVPVTPVTIGVNQVPLGCPGPGCTSSLAIDPALCGLGFNLPAIATGKWFSFNPPITGVYDFDWIADPLVYNYNGSSSLVMAVYDQPSLPADPSLVVNCSWGYDAVFMSYLPLIRGTTYLINVGTFQDSHNAPALVPGDLTIELLPGFADLCHGDGGNPLGCTLCPCSNDAPSGTRGGCLNSAGTSALLTAGGLPSVSLPPGTPLADLFFVVNGAPPNALCILKSGAGAAPTNPANPCFGQDSGIRSMNYDGLRCAVGSTRRHGTRVASSTGTAGQWGGSGAPNVGIAQAGAGFTVGQTRYFQVVNREDALAGCMRGLNTSQAVEVTFTP